MKKTALQRGLQGLLLLAAFASPTSIQPLQAPTISGLAFGDNFLVTHHHNPAYRDIGGFVIRRVYLNVDQNLDDGFSSRLRLEYNQADFGKTPAALTAFVKEVYLAKGWDGHKLTLGLAGTPIYMTPLSFWGYRQVEQTPLLLQLYAASVDLGIRLNGEFLDHQLRYMLMAGNGDSIKSQGTDRSKTFYAALGFHPLEGCLAFEAYADYRNHLNDDPEAFRYTTQLFAGYQGSLMRLGLLYGNQTTGGVQDPSNAAGNLDNTYRELASGWLVFNIHPQWSAFARVDHTLGSGGGMPGISYLQSAPDGQTILFYGLDYRWNAQVSFLPNIAEIHYHGDKAGPKPDSDRIVRLTMYYQF